MKSIFSPIPVSILTFIFLFALLITPVTIPARLPGINLFNAGVQANGACYSPPTPEEEGGSEVIHLPIREVAAMNMIRLSDLAGIYGWQFDLDEDRVTVTTCAETAGAEAGENEENEDEIEARGDGEEIEAVFYLDELEYSGQEIYQSPLLDNGEIHIGPELTRLLVRDLVGDELKYITWLESDSRFYRSGDEVEVNIDIWNVSGEERTLNFSSGQIYDIMIMSNGWVDWRWSDGRAFTMALQTKKLDPNEKMSWQESFILRAGLESGDYQLGGKITAREEIPLNSIDIEIRQI